MGLIAHKSHISFVYGIVDRLNEGIELRYVLICKSVFLGANIRNLVTFWTLK